MTACIACGATHTCLCNMQITLDGKYACKGCVANYNQSLAPKPLESVQTNPVNNGTPYQVPAPVINSITHFNNY